MHNLDKQTINLLKNTQIIVEIDNAFLNTEKLLSEVHLSLYDKLHKLLPIDSKGKISKGRNYKGLPYIVSDLPNHFKKDDIFCLRTMFWWGNEFSIAIYLSGKSLLTYKEKVLKMGLEHYFCVGETLWEYHFDRDNYIPSEELTIAQKEAFITKNGFLKVAQRIPLDEFSTLDEKAIEFYSAFMG